MKFKFDDRPTCSCGTKMELIEYIGFYERFRYWACESCNIRQQMQRYEVDKTWTGAGNR